MREIPVFLFTGFIDSGKTTFIQDTLDNPEFGADGRSLLLVCEEGETEYNTKTFAGPGVRVEYIRSEEELNVANLRMIAAKGGFDRVLVEYNGMWENQKLFEAMPRNWMIAQEMTFFDANTFMMFNRNMRQLCYNKMMTAEMVVFNRCTKGFDKMPFHKEVRIANRKSLIVYEYAPNDLEVDDIEDPLPYDLNEKRITIEDDWFAEWYRDINENEMKYDGKTFDIKGRVALSGDLPPGQFAFGRHVMTCCEADIQFAGLLAYYTGGEDLEVGDWVSITAKVRIEYTKAYNEEGPVLYVKRLERCEPCDPEVATF